MSKNTAKAMTSGAIRLLLTLLIAVALGGTTQALAQSSSERFAGYLRNSAGQTLAGGTVSVNGISTSSERDGYFEIYAPTTERYVIRANKPGHAPYSDTHVGPGLEQLDIRLLTAETTTVDPQQPINIADSRSTRVQIAAGSLVDSQGRTATVPLQLSMRTYDLGNEEMIGDMTAVNSQGQRVILQSLGAFSIEFRDASGNLYNLAPGRTARITMPVDPANTYSGPVPLWHFNETLGYWVQEGMGQVQNGVATGDVPHFSAWNFDLEFTSSACTSLYIAPGVFLPKVPSDPLQGIKPVSLRFRVLLPGWPYVKDISVEASGPHVLYALPPNALVEVFLDGTAYTIYNTGAAWTGPATATHPYIPRSYTQCNSSVYVDNRTPKSATIRGTVKRQHRSSHAGTLVTLMSGSLKFSTTTDASGNFSILTPVNSNTVSVSASRGGHLSVSRASIAVSPGATVAMPAVSLLAGDVNGDNCVDWKNDVQVIGNAMGTTVTSDDRRDVDGNFRLEYTDVSLAAANGGLCGPRPW